MPNGTKAEQTPTAAPKPLSAERVAGADRMTIEELAARAGCTTRNIRNYQTLGVVPHPTLEGRVGLYDEGHLARLRLVAQLQEHGFSLAGIAQLLAAWEQGRTLADVLGFEAALTEPWTDEEPELIPPEELLSRFPEAVSDLGLVTRAVDAGLIDFEGEQVRLNSPRLIDVGAGLVESGVPLSAILDELTALRSDLDRIAKRFVAMFDDHVWGPFAAAGMPAENLGDVTSALRQMRPLAAGAVEVILAQAMQRRSSANTAFRAALGDLSDREATATSTSEVPPPAGTARERTGPRP